MNFLYPAMLWSLVAIAIPIVIHLFNFRRTKKIYFSNVSLLKSVEVQTSSFRKLKNWLVLASRIFAIICLVMAFAQPFIPTENQRAFQSNGATSIYLDNSFSMQNELSNQRLIDRAITSLNEVAGLLKSKGNIQLLTNDFMSDDVALVTPDQLRDRLTTITLTPTHRSLEQIFHRQKKTLDDYSVGGNQYFLISDFQKSTAGNLSAIQPDSANRLYIVPVQFPVERNLYIDSIWLDNPFVKELQNNVLYVKIRNTGDKSVTKQAVQLYIEDMQVSSASVTIEAHSSTIIHFNFSLKSKGIQRGKILFDDFPITFDNEYYFIVKTSPTIKVHHLYNDLPREGSIRHVFSNDSLFDVAQNFVQNVDYGLLKQADLVVLEGVHSPSAILLESINELLSRGGSLLIIPSKASDISVYQSWLSQYNLFFTKTPVVEDFIMLNSPDPKIPFFADVYENTRGTDQSAVDMPRIKRLWSWNRVGETLLETKDGKPFLTSLNAQKGNIMVLGSPLQSEFSTLSQHALYLPMMYKIATSSMTASSLAYNFSSRFVEIPISKETTMGNKIVKLKSDDLEIIPIQRMLGDKLLLEIPTKEQLAIGNQLKPGYYDVLLDEKKIAVLALNFTKEESDLAMYTVEELKNIWPGNPYVEVLEAIDQGRFTSIFEDSYLGTSLWKYFVIAALVFLFIEIGLLRWLK